MEREKIIHLVGHFGRSLPVILASCRVSVTHPAGSIEDYKKPSRFTLNPMEVTCKNCLRIIKEGQYRDPIHKIEPNHNCW